jgi:uncharacterized protein
MKNPVASRAVFLVLRGFLLGLALVLAPLLARVSAAQNVPPRPNPPRLVTDLAGLLQPGEVQALEQKLLAYNDSTSSQVAVVTVPTLDGSDIESYAQALYQSWGIGQKGKDNGLLILIANQEHKVRIQPGYGLEGAIPDAMAGRIIRNTMAPAFRQNQYYAGLDKGIDELEALARGEYKRDPNDVPARTSSRGRSGSGSGFPFIIFLGILILIFIFRNRGGGGGGRRNRGFGGGFIPPIIFGGGFGGGGGSSWGGGGGGGGGFGGFGGGNSGGGGASGSW